MDGATITANVTDGGSITSNVQQSQTVIATVTTGAQGAKGDTGATGPGVPTGGTTSQVLRKASDTDHDDEWHSLDSSDVGLGNVDNTADADKPVSDATQTALNAKVPTSRTVNSHALSSNVTLNPDDLDDSATTNKFVTAADLTLLGNTSGTNTGDQTSVTGNAGTATKLATARDINGVAFDGTADITVADSTKVPTTRTVNGHALSADVTVSASDVGLGSVTDDAQLKASQLDTDGTLTADSDTKIASQKATKTYVDTGLGTKQDSLGFTAEDVANKDTSTALGTSDTKYPSQKAVKAYADGLGNASILQPYWDALADNTAVTAFIGDSISYGYLVAQDEAFPSKVQQTIRKRYGGAYTNFTPADCGNSGSPSDSGRGTSQSGTLTRLVTGFAAAAVGTNASGVSQTFTTNRACTEIGIWYGKGPTLGNLKITVDGGSPTTIDTGNATQSWGNVWSSGTLSSAVHTIKVEGATGGSLNSGYSTAVEAYFFDSATTPKVLGSWRQGNKTSQFTQAVNPNWQEGYANNYPDVVVIHLGTNDAVAGVSAATYQTNLQEIVTTLNALATPPSAIVVGAMPKSNYLTGSTYTDYYNAVATVVANNANTLLWDINEDLGDNQATNYADVFTAGVHPNAYGHQVMANSIARIILPPYNEYQEIRQAAGDVGIAGQTDYNGTSGTGAGVVTTPNFFNSRKFGAAVPTYPGQILTAIDTFNVAQAGWQAPAPNRYTLTVSGSTYTIDTNKTGLAIISSPSADFTVTTSGNTPLDGQPLILRVKSGATPYVPTWNSIFTSSGLVTLPTTYPASKTVTHKFAYDAVATKWVLMALDPTGY